MERAFFVARMCNGDRWCDELAGANAVMKFKSPFAAIRSFESDVQRQIK